MGKQLIEGVVITPLKIVANPKGDILHVMKKSDPGFFGFGEAYFTKIISNEIKGWNRHRTMTLNLCVSMGKVLFILYDDREKSKTRGTFLSVKISVDDYKRLTVPPGVWLAFMGMGDDINLILNIADMEHDPDEIERRNPFDSSIPYDWDIKNQ